MTDQVTDVILCGDSADVLKTLPDCSVDAVVSDPPAGIAFMDATWDKDKGGRDKWIAWLASIMAECYRILKPGGHVVIWALPRTSHWTATALEDAGFEIRDCLYHVFGEGFPHGINVGKAIDKLAGAERAVVGSYRVSGNALTPIAQKGGTYIVGASASAPGDIPITAPATPEAAVWEGWNTSLKPAVECWWLCRKPISESSIAANVLKWGTGALNIQACRVGTESTRRVNHTAGMWDSSPQENIHGSASGRWPAHLLLSHTVWCEQSGDSWRCAPTCPVAKLDRQSGYSKGRSKGRRSVQARAGYINTLDRVEGYVEGYDDAGGASRYFTQLAPDDQDELIPFLYCGKARKVERNAGCENLPEGGVHRYGAGIGEGKTPEAPVVEKNTHPTVKPLALMRWLVRLVTPPGGLVLDPFAGSGSTLVACVQENRHFIEIEQQAEYAEIAQARVKHAQKTALSPSAATTI